LLVSLRELISRYIIVVLITLSVLRFAFARACWPMGVLVELLVKLHLLEKHLLLSKPLGEEQVVAKHREVVVEQLVADELGLA